jgi:hypothetical protein
MGVWRVRGVATGCKLDLQVQIINYLPRQEAYQIGVAREISLDTWEGFGGGRCPTEIVESFEDHHGFAGFG